MIRSLFVFLIPTLFDEWFKKPLRSGMIVAEERGQRAYNAFASAETMND